MKVRARLLFEVISTANNKIFAESIEAAGPLPIGAKFSGTGSYANKRAFIQFSEVQFNDRKYQISGTAIQGTSPGLVAEVTDLSTNNAAANTVIGLTRAGGTVLGAFTGGTAGNVVNNITDPHTNEIQRTEEAKKVTVEYKVPAKTPMFINFD